MNAMPTTTTASTTNMSSTVATNATTTTSSKSSSHRSRMVRPAIMSMNQADQVSTMEALKTTDHVLTDLTANPTDDRLDAVTAESFFAPPPVAPVAPVAPGPTSSIPETAESFFNSSPLNKDGISEQSCGMENSSIHPSEGQYPSPEGDVQPQNDQEHALEKKPFIPTEEPVVQPVVQPLVPPSPSVIQQEIPQMQPSAELAPLPFPTPFIPKEESSTSSIASPPMPVYTPFAPSGDSMVAQEVCFVYGSHRAKANLPHDSLPSLAFTAFEGPLTQTKKKEFSLKWVSEQEKLGMYNEFPIEGILAFFTFHPEKNICLIHSKQL